MGPTRSPTKKDSLSSPISSREDRTRIDSRRLTRTPRPRPPRSRVSTTRERVPTADSTRLLLLSELNRKKDCSISDNHRSPSQIILSSSKNENDRSKLLKK